ncbi:MAG TPA: NlpC/P60 family protein [Streptosporangiaceae bacterium]|nr:NlpC/P60 family protein [Streptosporangiaceae bacterium]
MAAGAALLLLGLVSIPLMVVGGSTQMFAAGGNCSGQQGSTPVSTTPVSTVGKNSIPSDYLFWFQKVSQQSGVPWPILAGIGKVESNFGQSNLPGVHSGQNGFGAAGPMQIGITGAAGNTWGGAPVHPASEHVSGVATDENGDGIASVYQAPDAIAGAAKYLLENGVLDNVSAAIFAYNHLVSYVQLVLNYAKLYAQGGFTISPVSVDAAPQCLTGNTGQAPNQAATTAIAFAEAQLGKPYQWGGTGPDAFDCSGLVMMAYRAAGINIPRTSQEQWAWGPKIAPGQEEPGDLVFFAGSDGTMTNPGHVGIVIGKNLMVEAYATGFPIRISSFGTSSSAAGDGTVVGFTRPWAHAGVVLPGTPVAAGA